MKKYIVYDKDNNIIGASEGAYFEMENGTTVEVTEEIDYSKFEGLTFKDGKIIFDENRYTSRMLDINKEDLRSKREVECFDVVNRGEMWYTTYVNTPERETEFKNWYQAWLDVTDTMIEPTKPTWIK